MKLVFEEAKRLLEKGERFVLATVVATKGSTPQKAGAKLLIREDGTIVGTLGGGCVEADVRIEARRVLAENDIVDRTLHFHLNEDIAFKDGLVCGGNMDIAVESFPARDEALRRVSNVLDAYEGRGDFAIAVRFQPGSPSGPQSSVAPERLFISGDGDYQGEFSSDKDRASELESETVSLALELMPRGRQSELRAEDGSRVSVESYTMPATVVIAGGGHVGKAIYSLADQLGFRAIIVDDRPDFANAERFPNAHQVVVDAFDAGLRSLDLGPNHYVIIATRGHKLDDIALLEAARSKAGYVGLLGSKRKAVLIFRDLYRAGVPEERIREIRAPIGLDIGGRQPAEIALSILAEIVAVRNDVAGGPMSMMDESVLAKIRGLASR